MGHGRNEGNGRDSGQLCGWVGGDLGAPSEPVGLGAESAICLCGHWFPGLAACRTAVGEGKRHRVEWPAVESKGDVN